VPVELDQIIGKALAKDRQQRYQHLDDLLVDLRALRKRLEAAETRPTAPRGTPARATVPPTASSDTLPRDHTHSRPQPSALNGRRVLGPAVGAVVLLAVLGTVWMRSPTRSRRGRAETLLALQEHVSRNEVIAAFVLARDARKDLAADPEFREIWDRVAANGTVRTTPPGATIALREYGDFGAAWVETGRSPLEAEPLPRVPLQLRLQLEGFQTREVSVPARLLLAGVEFKMERIEQARQDVVRVPPENVAEFTLPRRPAGGILEATRLPAFEVDRFEVTNGEFAKFVQNGGYQNRALWKGPFVLNGQEIPFEQAIARFVDATGRPGPATWRFGAYPDGQQDYPVGGVSWYEAAAYAESAGKMLPTLYHWDAMSGARIAEFLALGSNFGEGPQPVGSAPARSPVGAADTAGNVREWCWNAVGRQRLALGAAWSDPVYQIDAFSRRDPFDRDAGNGFRCARYDPAAVPPAVRGPVERKVREYSQERPANDPQFEIFRRFYAYDPVALKVISHDTLDMTYWTLETVSYESAYGERIPAYVYLPKNAAAPYQSVVYFPGSTAEMTARSENRREDFVHGLVRSGRAVIYPVCKGTYERAIRGDDPVYLTLDPPAVTRPRARQDNVIMAMRDVLRSVDYLESRQDMRTDKIAYFGASLGARLGAIALALEHRFAAAVLLDAGLHLTSKEDRLPESDEINFLPRVRAPTLMSNGRFDRGFPVEESQRYFYQWLGATKKRHLLHDRDHIPGVEDAEMREMLGWLDEHLGVPDPSRTSTARP
jgi:formylglycine-generating enzyme required for sulfatase activity/dienelactone hydrolase